MTEKECKILCCSVAKLTITKYSLDPSILRDLYDEGNKALLTITDYKNATVVLLEAMEVFAKEKIRADKLVAEKNKLCQETADLVIEAYFLNEDIWEELVEFGNNILWNSTNMVDAEAVLFTEMINFVNKRSLNKKQSKEDFSILGIRTNGLKKQEVGELLEVFTKDTKDVQLKNITIEVLSLQDPMIAYEVEERLNHIRSEQQRCLKKTKRLSVNY